MSVAVERIGDISWGGGGGVAKLNDVYLNLYSPQPFSPFEVHVHVVVTNMYIVEYITFKQLIELPSRG